MVWETAVVNGVFFVPFLLILLNKMLVDEKNEWWAKPFILIMVLVLLFMGLRVALRVAQINDSIIETTFNTTWYIYMIFGILFITIYILYTLYVHVRNIKIDDSSKEPFQKLT